MERLNIVRTPVEVKQLLDFLAEVQAGVPKIEPTAPMSEIVRAQQEICSWLLGLPQGLIVEELIAKFIIMDKEESSEQKRKDRHTVN